MPTPFNFAKAKEGMDKPAQKPQNSSGWLAFESGDNRIRILTEPTTYPEHFNEIGYKGICIGHDDNCPGCLQADQAKEAGKEDLYAKIRTNSKYLVYALDRRDGQIKLTKLTYGVWKQIVDFGTDPDWNFVGFPLPVDTNIRVDKTAGPAGYYKVVPSPNRIVLTNGELAELTSLTPTDIIVQKVKDKKIKELSGKPAVAEPVPYPTDDIEPGDIPF